MTPARLLLYSLADGVLAAVTGATVVVGLETVDNRWLQGGLGQLPLLMLRDRFAELLVPVLGIAAGAALLAVLARAAARSGRLVRACAVGIAAGSPLAVARFGHQVVPALVDRSHPSLAIWLVDQQLLCRAHGPRFWGSATAVVLALLVARAFANGDSTIGKALRRWLPAGAAVLAAGVLAAPAIHVSASHRSAGRRNVILVVLDTVAAGHMRLYGYDRDTTPELEALARRGALFSRAYTVAGWTLPAHASMFTGVWPVRHRATQESARLGLSWNTLAEILRADGYRTFGAANNPIVGSLTHLDQGFGTFIPTWEEDVARAYGRNGQHPNNTAALRFLDGVGRGERFFLFLNYCDAHGPYEPREPFRSRFLPQGVTPARVKSVNQNWRSYYLGRSRLGPEDFEILRALYDAELSEVSVAVADLMRDIEKRGLLEDTLVIITSDHGENVGDHGHLDHVFTLYDTVLRVPLFVLGAGVPGSVVDERPVSVADVFPTVLAAARSSWPVPDGPTRDLLAPRSSEAEPEEMVAEYYYPNQVLSAIGPVPQASRGRLAPYLRRLRALRTEEWKLIWASDGRHELYSMREDPHETNNLAGRQPARVLEMTNRLEQLVSRLKGAPFRFADEPPPREAVGFEGGSEETIEKLRSLGYVR